MDLQKNWRKTLIKLMKKSPGKIEKTGDAIKDKVEKAASSLAYASITMVI